MIAIRFKMKIILFIAYFFPAFAICQTNLADRDFSEWKEWNLKGNIKRITNYIFDKVDVKLEQSKLIDTAKCSRVNTVLYDRKGNATVYENITKSKTGGATMRSESKMSYSANKRVGIHLLNGDTFSISLRQWISDTSYTDTIKNAANQNMELNTTVVNSKRNIKSQRIESLKKYEITKPVTLFFKFNDSNQLSEIVTKFENGNEAVEVNKDVTFDKIGNPTKSIKQQKNKRTLIIRKYEYY